MERVIQRIPAKPRTVDRILANRRRIRLAAYARVSTMNEDQLDSFENQVTHYREYAKLHPEYDLVKIYADEGITGTNIRRRKNFKQMIMDCQNHKIDMVITKSISRFARNTQDCLHFARQLKDLGIPIFFEKENINTMDGSGELLFTILSSLAQDESRSISENCSWGIRALFRQGQLHLNANRFLGYDKGEDGKLVVNKEQGAIVHRIYTEFMNGINPDVIAKRLCDEGVPGVMGKPAWTVGTIKSILTNEKHMGDALLQKYYTVDFLMGKTIRNDGVLEQTYIKGDHEPIIDKTTWEAVQQELKRRKEYMAQHKLRTMGRYTDEYPFTHRVVCGICDKIFSRRTWYRMNKEIKVWQCSSRYTKKGVPGCGSENLFERDLHRAFIMMWNELLETREERMERWMTIADSGTELEAFRALQMIDITENAEPLKGIDNALVAKVLDHVVVQPTGILEFYLLDGTTMGIAIND